MFNYSFPAVKGIQANSEYYISMVPCKLLKKLFVKDNNLSDRIRIISKNFVFGIVVNHHNRGNLINFILRKYASLRNFFAFYIKKCRADSGQRRGQRIVLISQCSAGRNPRGCIVNKTLLRQKVGV